MKKAALANSLLGGGIKPADSGGASGNIKRKSINYENGTSPGKRASISDAAEM